MPLARHRGALLAPVHKTHRQDTLPALGTNIASKANRDGVAERCADPAVHTSLAVDRALITYDDARRRAVELPLGKTAQHHDAHTRYRRHTVPGIGTMLRLVLRDDIHASARVPRGQDCASSCRLVTCAKASAGQRSGTSGTHIGNAHLPWAFAKAAVVCFRDTPAGQPWLRRLANKPSKGKALTILAHTWARAVSDRCKRQTACARHTCLPAEGRRVGEPNVALDSARMPLRTNARPAVNPGVSAHA